MKPYDLYIELERIQPDAEQTVRQALQPFQPVPSPFQKAWKLLQAFGTHVIGSSEPRIRQRCDRQGNPYYQIDDPVSRQRLHFDSELEVRAWLEQRYYFN